ncbi:allatostatin-A receptor isoform X1 [Orussus abietinus]|uniref:allatostatin-A receptor isoform X1 n=1 Tax=Orussus abietinus TaxID=222816 RepID=UPI000C715AB7|nr:allatostatin-A receptor isoform X1 [Orussus abietinus]
MEEACSGLNLSTCTGNGTSKDEDAYAFDYQQLQNIVSVVVPVFFGVIGLLGLVGNFLVVIVVAANPNMRSTTNLLIINLAIADLLFVIFCVPFTATDYVMPFWPFGNIWCKCVQYLIIVTACASVYTLVLMSLDRYLAVVHPIASMSVRTEAHAFLAICIAWAVILTASIPAFVIHGEVRSFGSKERTQRTPPSATIGSSPGSVSLSGSLAFPQVLDSFQDPYNSTVTRTSTACRVLPQFNWPLFQVTFFLSSYIVPLTLICGLYVCMLLRLWRGAHVSAESRRGKRRVTRMVLIVVGVFAISWCPIQMILVIKSLDLYPMSSTAVTIQIASHVLAYANSCVNPILYAFLSDNFRKAFRKIIYCRPRQDPHHRLGPATRTTRAASTGDII